MSNSVERPLFSVIIPTRNRPSQLAVALNSVLEQRFRNFEVIIVNDGSSEEHEPKYGELVQAPSGAIHLLTLVRTERGHGPGYAGNHGATYARGDYLCFLDDDDQWTDPEHLGRVASVIAAAPRPDLILSNQRAYRAGMPVPQVIWIEDLVGRLHRSPDPTGAYIVTPAELMRCQAHCHLNTLIVLRSLFFEIGAFDETLRYDQDRDLYLRALDRSTTIKFLPLTVSRHNIPDPATKMSASTAESELSRRLYQLRTSDKVVLFANRVELRRHEMRYRAYILRHIATEAARIGRFDTATYYAREALTSKFTLKWLAMTALFGLRKRYRFEKKLRS